MTYRLQSALCSLLVFPLLLCAADRALAASGPLDEAKLAGRGADSMPPADEDYFELMDNGIDLTADEVKGRNMWLVWTGGNDRFWDDMTVATFGTFDLLKTISSHPSLKNSRDNRWQYLGVVNEPCFEKATGPDPERFGLWLDQRRADCPPDPFANEDKYPGIEIGARGRNMPVGSYYGEPTGVVGLRLFPNPAFDAEAQRNWDPVRYYEDPDYYLSKDLVRPYRVGMSCGFCHVGPSPINPPADPENPAWENLNSTVGAQYFWFDRIFAWDADPRSYMFQLIHAYRPGTLDTSLVSSDYIVNPRTMNAVYSLDARLEIAKRWGKETLADGELNNKQFNDYISEGPLTAYFETPDTVWTPRVLKDGADSVGALGALNRVYLNIGLFSEEWTRHFNPFVGGTPITPIEITTAQENSSYWQATEAQTPLMALFFLKAGQAGPAGRRAGRRGLSERRSGGAGSRQGGVRRALRALPFEQDPGAGAGRRSRRRLLGAGLSAVLERVLGVDQDRRVQGEDARDRVRRRFPRGQLPVDRNARAGDAAADQRLQPARHQRHCRQHLGQLLVADL